MIGEVLQDAANHTTKYDSSLAKALDLAEQKKRLEIRTNL